MSTRPWEEGVMHAGSNQNAPSMYIIILAMPMGDLLVCKPPANIAADASCSIQGHNRWC